MDRFRPGWNGLKWNGLWKIWRHEQNELLLIGMEWSGTGWHGEGESFQLKEVRSMTDPTAELKPLLVTLDLHTTHYHTHTRHLKIMCRLCQTHAHRFSLISADETGNTQIKQTNGATIRQTAAEYMQTMVDTHMTNSTIHGQKKKHHFCFVLFFKKKKNNQKLIK